MTPNISSRHNAAVIIVAAMLMTACTVEAQRVEGSFEKTLTVGQQTDVEIMSGSGSIEVRQGSVGRVEIRARVRAGDWGLPSDRPYASELIRAPGGQRLPFRVG